MVKPVDCFPPGLFLGWMATGPYKHLYRPAGDERHKNGAFNIFLGTKVHKKKIDPSEENH